LLVCPCLPCCIRTNMNPDGLYYCFLSLRLGRPLPRLSAFFRNCSFSACFSSGVRLSSLVFSDCRISAFLSAGRLSYRAFSFSFNAFFCSGLRLSSMAFLFIFGIPRCACTDTAASKSGSVSRTKYRFIIHETARDRVGLTGRKIFYGKISRAMRPLAPARKTAFPFLAFCTTW
jgi:hypothetical protein